MTVYSLDVAKEIVAEDPSVLVVYEYSHLISGKILWSIEHEYTFGNTLISPYVVRPRVVYQRGEGWKI